MRLKQIAAAKWRMSSSERNDRLCNVSWLCKRWEIRVWACWVRHIHRCNADWLIRGTLGCQHYKSIPFPFPDDCHRSDSSISSSLAAHVKRYFSCHFMLQLFEIKSMRKDFSPANYVPTRWQWFMLRELHTRRLRRGAANRKSYTFYQRNEIDCESTIENAGEINSES